MAWISVLVATALPIPAAAQDSKEVNVIVEFGVKAVRELYEPGALAAAEKKAAEAIISGALANVTKVYRSKFRWRLQPCDETTQVAAAGLNVTAPPALRIRLAQGEGPAKAWVLEVVVHDPTGDDPAWLPPKVVLRPDESSLGLVVVPNADDLPTLLAEWFETAYLRPDGGEELLTALRRRAPIGVGLVLTRQEIPRSVEDAQGLLLLNFVDFMAFTRSRFKVRCQLADHAPVELISSGAGLPWPFKPNMGRNEFQAILVRHQALIDGDKHKIADKLPLLPRLSGAEFYLDDPPGTPVDAARPPAPGRLQTLEDIGAFES